MAGYQEAVMLILAQMLAAGGVLAIDPSVKFPSGHVGAAGSRGRFTWGQSASVSAYPAGNGWPATMAAGGVVRGIHMG